MRTKRSPLSNVLFSKVQQRIFALLYGRPERSFYTNEIIRHTHSGRGAIQRELKKLSEADLIKVERVGNQVHYQANEASPLFSELRGIINKTFGLGEVLQQALKSIAPQITLAFIYGSMAKQEDTAKSDVDLMIVTDTLTYAEIYPLLEKAEAQLHRSINPTFYSPQEWKRKLKHGNLFLTKVLKQPKIFLIGNEDDLNKLK